MTTLRKTLQLFLKSVLTLVIAVLVLQALAYGLSFAIDPAVGVDAFGYEAPAVVDDLTVALVGMAGVGMIGTAALLVLSAILVWRVNPAGAYLAAIVGAVYLGLGRCSYRAEWWWDANFYGLAGTTLLVLAVAVRWLQAGPAASVAVSGRSA